MISSLKKKEPLSYNYPVLARSKLMPGVVRLFLSPDDSIVVFNKSNNPRVGSMTKEKISEYTVLPNDETVALRNN